MIFNHIETKNTSLLNEFISCEIPSSFRYFNTRTVESVKNHKLTIVCTINNEPVGYGHIDYENGINWIAICVLYIHQSKGYGKSILKYIIDFSRKNNIDNLQLSVDIDNWKAINLYAKHGFAIKSCQKKYYIMEHSSVMSIPISIGEAVDKLTILDIKKQKITDESRISFVNCEYDILYNKLSNEIQKYKYFYDILLDINKNIWEMQDKFRNSNNDVEKNKLCLAIIDDNDKRFRVKKKLNDICKSYLKEQKGYKPKKCFVLTHFGLGDHITAIGAVRYLSTYYDETIVCCRKTSEENLKLFYLDDDSIKTYGVDSEQFVSPKFRYMNSFNSIEKTHDVYTCGIHLETNNRDDKIPFNFYNEMKIDKSAFRKYFYVPHIEESKELYKEISSYKYIFVHDSSSTGKVFSLNKLNLNIDSDMLLINCGKNMYEKGHKFYDIAEKFVNKPLLYYVDSIENASIIVLSDSCIFCLAIQLNIKTDECYYFSRDKFDYNYLFSEKYNFDSSRTKTFKRLTLK